MAKAILLGLASQPHTSRERNPMTCKSLVIDVTDRQGEVIQVTGVVIDITEQKRADGVCTDITDRRQAEEELAEAKEADEAANRAKSEFLATMSREIRTPMTAIMGVTDLLMSLEVSPGERQGYLETIHRNAECLVNKCKVRHLAERGSQIAYEYLLAIINAVLDLAKLDAGQVELEQIICSLWAIVEEVRSSARVHAAEKSREQEIDYEFPLPNPGVVQVWATAFWASFKSGEDHSVHIDPARPLSVVRGPSSSKSSPGWHNRRGSMAALTTSAERQA